MADLTHDDVLKLARLAHLDLSDAEVDEFANELSEILHYFEILQDVDVTGLLPTNQVTGLTNVTRPDIEGNYGYDVQDLLKNVPKVTAANQLQVKRMLD